MSTRRSSGKPSSKKQAAAPAAPTWDGSTAVDPPPPDQYEPPPENPESLASGAGAPRQQMTVGRSLEIATTAEVCMEHLVDKLRLLDYEREFCKRKKPARKPLSRLYFAVESPGGHSGEQFFYFAAMAGWLLNMAGVNDFQPPKEGDDPMQACNAIISALRKLGFAQPFFAPPALRNGHGKEVCGVLDGLCDYVLERRNFSYRRPIYLPETEDADVDEDPALDGAGDGEGADEFPKPQYADDDEEDAYMAADGGLGRLAPDAVFGNGNGAGAGPGPGGAAPEKEMLVSKVDPTQWRLELERVAPRLRILLNADAKDWRSHLEEVQEHSKSISQVWPDSRTVLEKLRAELNSNLEKLTTRERFLNEQFERMMQQYRAQRMQLSEVQEIFNKRQENISDRNNELARISEQLEEVRTVMDERGGTITDATPVVNIKKAIKKLSDELHEMEVRIGVVSNTLLQLSLKNRRLMHTQAAAMSDEEDV